MNPLVTSPLVTPFYIPWGWLLLCGAILIAAISAYATYKRRPGRGKWVVDAAVAIVATVLAVGAALYVIGSWYTGDWSLETFKQPPASPAPLPWGDLSRVATPVVTLVVAVVAAVLAGHGHAARLAELDLNTRNSNRSHALADTSALRDRFTTAAEQLGSQSSAIRLAGVYAMAALADDWNARERPADAQTCVDVLCGYLRTPRQSSEGGEDESRAMALHEAETTVRQTIITTFRVHLTAPVAVEPRAGVWSHHDFDLSHAILDFDVDLSGSRFTGDHVSFEGAELTGAHVSFEGAEFTGAHVSFELAAFTGTLVSFERAEFTGAHVSFAAAEFIGDRVNFAAAQFIGDRANFVAAQFTGAHVSFRSAQFAGGRATFQGAKFTGDQVTFDGAQFAGDTVTFAGAEFTTARVTFQGAKFTSGVVTFHETTFAGGRVTFQGAEFTTARVWFQGAKFAGDQVSFDGAKFTSEMVWFAGTEFTCDTVTFAGAEFTCDTVTFDGAQFTGGRVTFQGAKFTSDTVTFHEVKFAGDTVTFQGAEFTGGRVTFAGAEFTCHRGLFTAAKFNVAQLSFRRTVSIEPKPWMSAWFRRLPDNREWGEICLWPRRDSSGA